MPRAENRKRVPSATSGSRAGKAGQHQTESQAAAGAQAISHKKELLEKMRQAQQRQQNTENE